MARLAAAGAAAGVALCFLRRAARWRSRTSLRWVLGFGARRALARVRFVRALAAGSRMKNLWRPACAVRSAGVNIEAAPAKLVVDYASTVLINSHTRQFFYSRESAACPPGAGAAPIDCLADARADARADAPAHPQP